MSFSSERPSVPELLKLKPNTFIGSDDEWLDQVEALGVSSALFENCMEWFQKNIGKDLFGKLRLDFIETYSIPQGFQVEAGSSEHKLYADFVSNRIQDYTPEQLGHFGRWLIASGLPEKDPNWEIIKRVAEFFLQER